MINRQVNYQGKNDSSTDDADRTLAGRETQAAAVRGGTERTVAFSSSWVSPEDSREQSSTAECTCSHPTRRSGRCDRG